MLCSDVFLAHIYAACHRGFDNTLCAGGEIIGRKPGRRSVADGGSEGVLQLFRSYSAGIESVSRSSSARLDNSEQQMLASDIGMSELRGA